MSTEALDILRSIDSTLKQLLALSKVAKPKEVASDSDLDGKYGDPEIKAADPRDWTGPSMKGRKFSECSSEYLMLVADRFDYFAEVAERENKVTNTGKPLAPYNRRDAARARGWAKRVREGWRSAGAPAGYQAPAPSWENAPREPLAGWAEPSTEPLTSDDIPF